MSNMGSVVRYAMVAAVGLVLAFGTWASPDILDDWAKVEVPPAPQPQAVTLNAATTAFILGDMNQVECMHNPRCAVTVPRIAALAQKARAAGVMFWYSIAGGADATIEMVDKSFNPRDASEWERANGPDKFRGSKLEEKLKARKIERAIICGHSFQGFTLNTATGLALRGIDVIVPVDCSASNHPYPAYMEKYSILHLSTGADGVAPRVTITRTTMVQFN
jgi:nicotinamidase-related amidase